MTQKEILQVVEKESEIISEIKDVIEDRGNVKYFYFVVAGEFIEEKNQIVDLVDINYGVEKKNNYGVDNLVENCGSAKIDMIVNVNQSTQKSGNVENISGGNYDFVISGDFFFLVMWMN